MGERLMHRYNHGFTIIELLVVLLIISIIITMITLSIWRDHDSILREEINRLGALVDLAGDEATLQGRQLGVLFTQHDYRFLVYQADGKGSAQWRSLDNDPVFKTRPLSSAIKPDLILEGMPQSLPAAITQETEPQLFMLASGERTPFVLRLSSDDERLVYVLEAGPLGSPQWHTVESY